MQGRLPGRLLAQFKGWQVNTFEFENEHEEE